MRTGGRRSSSKEEKGTWADESGTRWTTRGRAGQDEGGGRRAETEKEKEEGEE